VSVKTGRCGHRVAGFTLVEVLVALAVMAIVAGLAWQGIDAMARSRAAGEAATQRTLALGTVMAQWSQDLQSLRPTGDMPALRYDGATLRLTRETPDGVQVVAWTLREQAWWRWASPAVALRGELQRWWEQSAQLLGNEPGTLRMMDGVQTLQLAYNRGGVWTNPQSTGDLALGGDAGAGTGGAGGATGDAGTGVGAGAGAGAGAAGGASAAGGLQERLPDALRLTLSLREGDLTRIVLVPERP
jgi:general secretion pathway protein J